MRGRVIRGLIVLVVALGTAGALQANPSLLLVENPLIGAGNYLNVPLPKTGLDVGQPAPDFALTTLDGERVQMERLRGKVVVLDFMATWCIPCQEQMPNLAKVNERYRDRGLVLISIDADPKETYQDLASFRSKYAAQWTFALDNGIAAAFRVNYIPLTYVIDREGTIKFKHLGYIDGDSLAREVEKYL